MFRLTVLTGLLPAAGSGMRRRFLRALKLGDSREERSTSERLIHLSAKIYLLDLFLSIEERLQSLSRLLPHQQRGVPFANQAHKIRNKNIGVRSRDSSDTENARMYSKWKKIQPPSALAKQPMLSEVLKRSHTQCNERSPIPLHHIAVSHSEHWVI